LVLSGNEGMDNDDLFGNTHATSVHPSGELHREVHHYEACDNDRHDGDADLNGGKQRYERYRGDLRESVLHHVFHHLGYVLLHDECQGCGVQGCDGQHHGLDVHVCPNG